MLLKVSDVARRLSLSGSKIYALVESRKLGHHRIDGAIRISEQQLADFLDETQRERGAQERPTRKLPRPRLRHVRL
jgi:excisionase family DNA binding protein